MTHFKVDISCHDNLDSPATSFLYPKDISRHSDWHDSSMSHDTVLGVTHFESKLAQFSLLFNVFYNKKYIVNLLQTLYQFLYM
jgi:hypothetical protein